MGYFLSFYRSSVGKKAVMAVTGILLFGFILGHMLGNMKLYLGAEALNHYAEWLRALGSPFLPAGVGLWIARLVLLGALAIHVHAAVVLTLLNRKARPVGYRRRETLTADYAARTMIWGGVMILLFVIYHLLHLTTGDVHPSFVHGDVYGNVVSGFQQWPAAMAYILANLALGFHLFHGLWSLFQSLGWNSPGLNPARRTFAIGFATIITAGNLSFPIAVLTGLVS